MGVTVGVLVGSIVGVLDGLVVGVFVEVPVAIEVIATEVVGLCVPALEHALENNKTSGIITDNWFIIAPSPLH